MSITDLIVELLEQGKSIEIDGIGTLGSQMRNAYHDPATHIFYPAGRTVVFDQHCTGDDTMVGVIAERECVGTEVARQMWRNYVDALSDKMQRTGSHTFGRLGTLTHNAADGYGFEATKGVVIQADNHGEAPIEDVHTYSHEGEEDPFARFEAEADHQAEAKAEAARKAAEAEAARKAAEAEAARKAAEAEAARKAAEEETARKAAEEEAAHKAAEAEAARKAAEAEAARKAAEAEAAEKARLREEEARLAQLDKVEATAAVPSAEPEPETEEKKKKSRWWLWLLLLLLLLALGAGAYYYFTQMRQAEPAVAETVEPVKHLEGVGAVNSLTYNCDMIEYSQRDMRRHSELVNQFMVEYIDQYLADHNYRSARVPMMDRVRQYSANRIEQLLGTRFAVQRLIPYNDYIYHYNQPFLKEVNGKHARIAVQRELMDGRLDALLEAIVAELGLEPDAGAPRTAAAVQEVKQAERNAIAKKSTDEQPANVFVEKGSKQGFDLIAGFYLDKATAARMSGRLHSLGCDAYIIEFNDLYYVSMGSANSQTAADALLKHVKSWYDGDVVIKKW